MHSHALLLRPALNPAFEIGWTMQIPHDFVTYDATHTAHPYNKAAARENDEKSGGVFSNGVLLPRPVLDNRDEILSSRTELEVVAQLRSLPDHLAVTTQLYKIHKDFEGMLPMTQRPVFPPKRVANTNPVFIENRRLMLQSWLQVRPLRT